MLLLRPAFRTGATALLTLVLGVLPAARAACDLVCIPVRHPAPEAGARFVRAGVVDLCASHQPPKPLEVPADGCGHQHVAADVQLVKASVPVSDDGR